MSNVWDAIWTIVGIIVGLWLIVWIVNNIGMILVVMWSIILMIVYGVIIFMPLLIIGLLMMSR